MVADMSLPGEDLNPKRVAQALADLGAESRAVVSRAHDEAYCYGSDVIGTAHLLMGLMTDTSHWVVAALRDRDISAATVREQFEQATGARQRAAPRHIHLTFSPHAKAGLIAASEQARAAGSLPVDPCHLWTVLCRVEGALARTILVGLDQLEYVLALCTHGGTATDVL
ncbi:Clp protease N-terminal domain-containing protein [Mycolicibacterium sp. CBM1]